MEAEKLDLVWGVAAIAKLIGRSQRQCFYMCQNGEIPVRKVGARWVVSRRALQAFFEEKLA